MLFAPTLFAGAFAAIVVMNLKLKETTEVAPTTSSNA